MNMNMNALYIIPIVIAWIIVAIVILIKNSKKMGNRISIDRPFKKDIYNELYNFSFQAPFKFFLPEDEFRKQQVEKEKKEGILSKFFEANKKKKVNKEKLKKKLADEKKKIEDTEELLFKSGFSNRFNFRSFSVLKMLVFVSCVILFFILNLILKNKDSFLKVFFNIVPATEKGQSSNFSNQLSIVVILLIICLIPQMFLKYKANHNSDKFSKDIPIMQLFITLMLRSNMSLSQILYVLSRTNSMYREIFELGYRIYIRNSQDGLAFLQSRFKNTKFEETIIILSQVKDYAKEEILHSLDNNMDDTIDYLNNKKRTADISKIVFSQASMIFPFASVLLLTLAPVAVYGLNSLTAYM